MLQQHLFVSPSLTSISLLVINSIITGKNCFIRTIFVSLSSSSTLNNNFHFSSSLLGYGHFFDVCPLTTAYSNPARRLCGNRFRLQTIQKSCEHALFPRSKHGLCLTEVGMRRWVCVWDECTDNGRRNGTGRHVRDPQETLTFGRPSWPTDTERRWPNRRPRRKWKRSEQQYHPLLSVRRCCRYGDRWRRESKRSENQSNWSRPLSIILIEKEAENDGEERETQERCGTHVGSAPRSPVPLDGHVAERFEDEQRGRVLYWKGRREGEIWRCCELRKSRARARTWDGWKRGRGAWLTMFSVQNWHEFDFW